MPATKTKKPGLTLGPRQVKMVSTAIEDLYDMLDSVSSSVSDYFSEEDLERIHQARCLMNGQKYVRSDYFEDEDEEE